MKGVVREPVTRRGNNQGAGCSVARDLRCGAPMFVACCARMSCRSFLARWSGVWVAVANRVIRPAVAELTNAAGSAPAPSSDRLVDRSSLPQVEWTACVQRGVFTARPGDAECTHDASTGCGGHYTPSTG